MEGVQIHAQWDGDDVRCADSVKFFAREPSGTHHGVVVGGSPCIGEISELLRGPWRKYLADKAIQAFMGDHHRGGPVFASPSPH